jgi:hypothetical protein
MARTKQTARRVISPEIQKLYDRMALEEKERKQKETVQVDRNVIKASIAVLEALKESIESDHKEPQSPLQDDECDDEEPHRPLQDDG